MKSFVSMVLYKPNIHISVMFICISRIVSMFIFFRNHCALGRKLKIIGHPLKNMPLNQNVNFLFYYFFFVLNSVQKWSCEWSFVFLHVPVCFLTNVDIVNLLCAISSEHKLWKLFSFLFYYILKVSWSLLVSLRQFSFSLIIEWQIFKPRFFLFDQLYNCPRMSIEQSKPSIIGTSKLSKSLKLFVLYEHC